ncbi:MAG: prolipoprotein diacylglyceryl transferase family protein, partial [Pseudomonadota bacterium]
HRFELLKKPGFLAGAFAFGYGIGRSVAEFYRVPDAHIGYLSGFLTMGILLSVPMILAGLVLMIWAARRPSGNAAA